MNINKIVLTYNNNNFTIKDKISQININEFI